MKISILSILLITCSALFSQITPRQALLEMGRGINMGNTLDAPLEGQWAPVAKEYYFDDYKTAGFKTVRIPVRWYPYTSETAPYTISETWMTRVETIIDWALDRGFYVIMDAHHSEPIKEDYDGQKERWDSIWSQVSFHFKDKSEKLFFELMNEPMGWTQAQLNDYNQRVLKIVRKTNPTRIVVLAGTNWSSANDLITPNLILPNDPYLFATYHQYDPWEFAGKGNGTWGTASDQNAIKASFDRVKNWSAQKGIPVLLGEFGATNEVETTKGVSDLNSRYRLYACYVQNVLRCGFVTTVWEDGGWYQIYDRNARAWNEIKDIITHYSPQSPVDFSANVKDDSIVILKWKNQATSYDSITVQRKRDGGNYVTIGKSPIGSVQYIDSSLIRGYGYHYRLLVHQKDTAASFSYPQYLFTTPKVKSFFNGKPFSLPGVIEAEEFDVGIEGQTYHDSSFGNEGGVFRADVDVDIYARNDGGYHVGDIDDNEWLEYTIDVTQAVTYNITAHVAAVQSGGVFKLIFERGATRTFSVPSTGGWETTTQITNTLRLPVGTQIMRVQVTKGDFNLDKIVFENPTGVQNITEASEAFKIYPNPSTGNFAVNSNGFAYTKLEVLNVNGQTVYQATFPEATMHSFHSCFALNKGIYVLSLSNKGEKKTQKFAIID